MMKTRRLIVLAFAIFISWMFQVLFNAGYSNESGAPAAVTGSPGDGNKTCAKSGCHTGFNVVNTPNLITSNIPATGYVPGTVYTITASCAQAGINKWGFEISPQDLSGNLLGQLILTNPGQTKLKSNKYITQTTNGSNGSGAKTWTFDWMAPLAGTGDVTFYGSFNYANNNGSDGGDHIHTSTMLVQENAGTSGVSEINANTAQLEVYPNPVREALSVKVKILNSCYMKIALMSADRKTVRVLMEEKVSAGTFIRRFELKDEYKAGIYFLTVSTGEYVLVNRIAIL